jgi:hypothetical protein
MESSTDFPTEALWFVVGSAVLIFTASVLARNRTGHANSHLTRQKSKNDGTACRWSSIKSRNCLYRIVVLASASAFGLSYYALNLFAPHIAIPYRKNSIVEQSIWQTVPVPQLKTMKAVTRCTCSPNDATKKVLIILTTPWRFFTSAHWFHICEYYLPHYPDVASFVPSNTTIYIQAPHDRFVSELTKITYFLLMLAFTNGAPARVEVLPPGAVARVGQSDLASITPSAGSFVYDASGLDPLQRFSRADGRGECSCARIVGEYGAAPIERGYW